MKMLSEMMKELWVKWELPGMVVLSLFLQFVLVGFGNRQRYQGRASPYIAILVWSTYLAADWIATVALSALLKAEKNELNSELVVFWTPFLLLHLGGPHTISAYSLSDNDLWLRYLLGLLIQVGVAIYVYVRFWTKSTLTYMAILIFVAGIVRYGERIWILRAASSRQFSNSVFSTPTHATEKSPIHSPSDYSMNSRPLPPETLEEYLQHKNVIEEGKYIHRAFCLFKMNIPLFSDLRLRIHRELSNIFLLSLIISAEESFKLMQIELGFLYDVLYTKTTILHSIVGVIIRGICLLSTFAALIAFSIVVGKSGYPRVDISITYLLLGGAIFLDIYSAISHAFSDWTMLWLTVQRKTVHKFVGRTIVSWLVCCKARKKGVASMAQHSLIDYCLKAKTSGWTTILRCLDTEDILGKFWLATWKQANLDLKNFILSHLLEKFKRYKLIKEKYGNKESDPGDEVFDHEVLLGILKERGNHVLHSNKIKEFKWSIDNVEFSHSILLWHIATFLLFYNDHKKYSGGALSPYCQISKLLSDYMMYLLLVQPLMLPKGIGEVRIRYTREEVIRLFGKEKSLTNSDATSALLHINYELGFLSTHKKSVLRDVCKLAFEVAGTG